MNNHQNNLLLKIFSGPHIGAEILLMPGEYVIGAGDDCDIVLQDSTIDLKHALLTVNENAVNIIPLDNKPLLIAGRLSGPKNDNSVEHFSVITIGTTHLAVGDEQGDWSKIRIPKISDKSFRQADDITDKSHDNLSHKILSFISNCALDTRYFFRSFRKRFVRVMDHVKNSQKIEFFTKTKNIIGLSVGFVLCLVVFSALHLRNGANGIEKRNAIYGAKMIATSSAVLGFSDVHAKPLDEANILVSGYVDDEDQLSRLINESPSLDDVHIDYDIYVGKHLSEKAGKILKQLDISDVDVLYQPKGMLMLSGYHANEEQWEQTKDMLEHDIPGVLSIDTDLVKNIKTRESNLRDRLNNQNLSNKISLDIEGSNILVSGILANDEIHKLKKIIDKFRNDYGKYPKIKLDLIDSQTALNVDIKSVRVGDISYIVTSEGDRYLAGSFLPNGFTIKSITPENIVMKKNKIEVTYPLN